MNLTHVLIQFLSSSVKPTLRKDNIDMIRKNGDEFVSFLMNNLRWTNETAMRRKNEIIEFYFPNLSAIDDAKIEEGLMNVSTII